MDHTKTLLGFRHALDGLIYAVKSQRNFQVHLITTLTVCSFGVWLGITRFEWLLLVFAITMVLTAELFNTAIESMADLITLKFSQHIKLAKDIAAGAVLISSLGAMLIGVLVFYPYLKILL